MKTDKIIHIEDIDNAKLRNTEPNDCNVLTDYHIIVISEGKKQHFFLRVAKHKNRYHFGFDYDYNTGGGCSSPHTNSRVYDDLRSGVVDMLTRLAPIENYSLYRQDMISVLKQLRQPHKPIQLTLSLF